MRLIQRDMLTARRRLHHGVILFIHFLILTVLAFAQVRCDELNCASDACAPISSASCRENAALFDAPSDQREQNPETPDSESWCFCCCAHILHNSAQTTDIALVKRAYATQSDHFLPTTPPKDHFHPTRSTYFKLKHEIKWR